jgi:hypothetical protein
VNDHNRENEPGGVVRSDLPRTGVEGQPFPSDLPQAAIEAAKREPALDSEAEPETAVAAILAHSDPAATFMKRTRGRLGTDHTLDY